MSQRGAVHLAIPCTARPRCLATRLQYRRPYSKLGGKAPAEIIGQRIWMHVPRRVAFTSNNHHEGTRLYLWSATIGGAGRLGHCHGSVNAALAKLGGLRSYPTMNHHVAALVARLHEQPSHTGSLIVTLFGDALLPRGSAIALATILDLFESLGIGPGVIRTAISRLAADGWLVASRRGRSSYYRIGPSRRGEFIRAARHIYGRPRGTAARSLIIALPEPGPGREPARERFDRLGFASWQGILLAPDRPLPRSLEAGSIVLRATGGPESLRRLAARAWRLDALCDHYKGFLAIFGGLTADAPAFDPRDALLARLLLIHDYRRIVLRDPRLPATFLPEEWAGDGARRLCAQLYEALLDASELWLSHNGATETGALPTADSTLRHRFADLRGHV